MKIKKVLNSSVILAIDDQDKEFICLGKGIGYNKKAGDIVEKQTVDQVFRPLENNKIAEYLALLESIPPLYLELTQKIIAQGEKELGCKFNVNIYFTLTDHLNFAVERAKQNILITNRVYWEIKNYYPSEFKIGLYALDLLNEAAGVTLPEEEAANIAFHIINATLDGDQSGDGMLYAKLISEIVNIVKYSIGRNLDEKCIHYQRFITHVKFFVERFFKSKLLLDDNEQMFHQISAMYPESMEIAFKISEFLKRVYEVSVPNDELTYLAVHINRLQRYNEQA